MEHPAVIYKLVPRVAWQEAERLGRFTGSPADVADGYIHLSTASQVAGTAAKHFAGMADLLLVTVSTADVAPWLRWEPSRGGALFPHVYGTIPITKALWVRDLPLIDGLHVFPPEAGA